MIGGLNTALSLFYYLRVVKVMTIDPEPQDRLPLSWSFVSLEGVFIVALTLPVIVFGVWFDGLNRLAGDATKGLFM